MNNLSRKEQLQAMIARYIKDTDSILSKGYHSYGTLPFILERIKDINEELKTLGE